MTDWKLATCETMFAASHLVWLYLLWALWSYRRKRARAALALRLLLALLFVWMRFVEPNWIAREETVLAAGARARVVLISDLHLGAFKGAGFVERLVARINAETADCVLIAGDFLYAPRFPLDPLLAPLKRINKPVYAVLGNHDRHELGPGLGEAQEIALVDQALERAGVGLIENRIVECGAVAIAGVGDRWSGREDLRAARAYQGSRPLLLLTHNPDTALDMRAPPVKLVLAAHTHGGQIRIPWLYKMVLPVQGPFDKGLHAPVTAGAPPVFVTSGVGETALPLRLFNPPVMDVLTLH